LELFNKAIRINPGYTEVYAYLAIVYDDLGEQSKSFESFQKAYQLSIDDPELYYNIGRAQYANNKYDKSINAFQKAIQLKANENSIYESYFYIASSYYNKGEDEKAIKFYQDAIQTVPGNRKDMAIVYYNLGIVYHRLNEFEKEKEAFKNAVLIFPSLFDYLKIPETPDKYSKALWEMK
jgi:tetratricopeptide (TPR) repeat protein